MMSWCSSTNNIVWKSYYKLLKCKYVSFISILKIAMVNSKWGRLWFFLLILMGFVLFNLPDCISSRFQYNFWVKTMCGSFFLPTLFPYQMVLVPFNINTMGVISGAGTANSSKFITSFWVHVTTRTPSI
jgi:hypothetical protein